MTYYSLIPDGVILWIPSSAGARPQLPLAPASYRMIIRQLTRNCRQECSPFVLTCRSCRDRGALPKHSQDAQHKSRADQPESSQDIADKTDRTETHRLQTRQNHRRLCTCALLSTTVYRVTPTMPEGKPDLNVSKARVQNSFFS